MQYITANLPFAISEAIPETATTPTLSLLTQTNLIHYRARRCQRSTSTAAAAIIASQCVPSAMQTNRVKEFRLDLFPKLEVDALSVRERMLL